MKGGISETRIEKRIVITGDADVDHDQVGVWISSKRVSQSWQKSVRLPVQRQCHQKMTQRNFTGIEIKLNIFISCGCSIPVNVLGQVGQGLKQPGLEAGVSARGRGWNGMRF